MSLRDELEALVKRESDHYWAEGKGGAATVLITDLRALLDAPDPDAPPNWSRTCLCPWRWNRAKYVNELAELHPSCPDHGRQTR